MYQKADVNVPSGFGLLCRELGNCYIRYHIQCLRIVVNVAEMGTSSRKQYNEIEGVLIENEYRLRQSLGLPTETSREHKDVTRKAGNLGSSSDLE